MYLADQWKDFAVLDAGGGNKLERWGSVTLLRPDPQAVWPMGKDAPGVDGYLFIQTIEELMSGDFVKVRVTGADEYDLIGEIDDEFTE